MIKRDGIAWQVVYAVLGVLTSYLTILSLLQFFESVRSEKKENGWLNKLIDCLIRPLVAVLEWMEKIFKRNALWGKALSFILVFLGGVVICILVSIPFFIEGLSLKCRFVFIYLAIIVLTCFISSPLVSNLFNNHLRADLMDKYRSEWGKRLVNAVYFVLVIVNSITGILNFGCKLSEGNPWTAFMIPTVIIPAFVTYIAIERVCKSFEKARN